MSRVYEAEDWRGYRMNWYDPHRQIEPPERERREVDGALALLAQEGILLSTAYDEAHFLAHRKAVRERFDIPWTAISPRLQRLMYAINAIHQPQVMVAVGIFCGNTFISNAGAAIGPGSVYRAQRLVGLEIRPEEADRARRNVATLDDGCTDGDHCAEIVAADGVPWLEAYSGTIDLLYLDADGQHGEGKSIYLRLLQAAWHALRPGALVLAHNSVNSAQELADYLAFARAPANFRQSANMIVDDQGLEVSMR